MSHYPQKLQFDYNEKPQGYYDQMSTAAPRLVLDDTEILYRTPFSPLREKGEMYAHIFVVRDGVVTLLCTRNKRGKDVFLTDEFRSLAEAHCRNSLEAGTVTVEKGVHTAIIDLTNHWKNATQRSMKPLKRFSLRESKMSPSGEKLS